ncbi:Flp pilus assembly protein CpaB [Acinetobacter venetianus]|uniref:Flp pilus assembly protein CpaB n=1 Tax=Acinetobacter venetianus (strain ATCC 31012 / DSM 23050 / BCRC 14357 / CCUG 45561 / CIP 110063 / KCTC 2702 / LMG 19082 / RAG-1) TaxID=1191460 RepID=N9A0T0_ACIVR|nr:Flp pilus assembly protein CpaB [Acinetobacter venetianus]ENV37638.1 flp pilus assembly protein CpaB [Acinetobacter venetianus RAG-1 = CIP 110063]QNH52007.1 Flp pilus assembly protein CpaB [Acinetobacter venetianus]
MNLPNINKKFVALLVSILVGVLSIWGFKTAFDNKVESMTQKGPGVAYVVASKELLAGGLISTDTVSQRNIPSDYQQSNAVLATDFGSIDGLPLKVDLKPGDIIMYSMVDTKKDIAKLIPLGRRALTIPVDDESSISTMLKPGDLIDLMVTLQSAEKTATVPLMQGVKILATGKQTDVSDEVSGTTGYTNITLDVSADDAKNITLATSMGRISAILRNPDDQVMSDTSGFIQLINTQKEQASKNVQPISIPTIRPEIRSEIKTNSSRSDFNIIYGNKDE